jgi:hypothetical protein
MTETNGQAYGVTGHIDEHFFRKYRDLLDAEDAAFDELEHAYEDGDRAHFEADFATWRMAVDRRERYLEKLGIKPAAVSV